MLKETRSYCFHRLYPQQRTEPEIPAVNSRRRTLWSNTTISAAWPTTLQRSMDRRSEQCCSIRPLNRRSSRGITGRISLNTQWN